MNTITEEPEVTTACTPRFVQHPAYRCLRVGDIAGFHRYGNEDEVVDLSGADLRGIDLRKADLRKTILRGAYLKDADLRGQDLRHVDLEGCSIRNAKVGGVYFPANIRSEEIVMSLQHGTRLRTT
ncbi:MAG TPA: pentapeptide repeat-containing protein [Pirellulaceae bacterium]|nr:pentapeptide repeat-containing protein [Pirellulaceae bacterium]